MFIFGHVRNSIYVYTCLTLQSCVHELCVFDAPQDLRPLYAGRCDYHSSEAERDVRPTSLHSLSSSPRPWCQVPVPILRCPVRRRHAPPATCGWRATPATAASSTTAASECAGQLSPPRLHQCAASNCAGFGVNYCAIFVGNFSSSFLLFVFCYATAQAATQREYLFLVLPYVSENILLLDFRIKMLWKSLGNHPWFGSRSLFSRISAIDWLSFPIVLLFVPYFSVGTELCFRALCLRHFFVCLLHVFCRVLSANNTCLPQKNQTKNFIDNFRDFNVSRLYFPLVQSGGGVWRLPWVHWCEELPGCSAPPSPVVVRDHP